MDLPARPFYILSFLSPLSLRLYAKTDGAFPLGTVHCINLYYLCQKKETSIWMSLFSGMNGIRKGGLSEAKAKKCPVDTFLARGRIHGKLTALRKECWQLPIFVAAVLRNSPQRGELATNPIIHPKAASDLIQFQVRCCFLCWSGTPNRVLFPIFQLY